MNERKFVVYCLRGPIDTTNAEILLDWSPSKFEDAVKATCEFFENAMVDPLYATERELLLAEFIEETLPEDFDDIDLFNRSLTNAYSPAVFKGIDIGLEIDSENLIGDSSSFTVKNSEL